MLTPESRESLEFRDFQLDVRAYELRRKGRAVRLERQPMDLLILLVEQRGQLVTRSQIVDRLWGKDVFVDVETGVNTAIRKVRQALRDSPETPEFIETVPGKGYRFIAEVSRAAVAGSAAPMSVEGSPQAAAAPRRSLRMPVLAALALSALAAGVLWSVWRNGSVPSSVRIAVLPFANLSGDPEREYLAEGLAEELIASIGQVDPDRLTVVARTSTLGYKDSGKSIADIGRELGAGYVVESSVREESGRLRVTSKLIRAADQVQVWSESFDREPVSMLGLQRELSVAIAERIRLRLSPDRLAGLTRRHTENPDAYDLYLRGLYFAHRRTPATTRRAIEYYSQATALDPDYALAWAGIANAYAASQLNGDAPADAVLPRAREAAARAVRAAPDLAETHHAAGYLNWCCEWNWPAAESGLRRALDLNPRFAVAHLVLGHALSQTGRHGEAQAAVQRARELDPLEPMMHALSSQVLFQARNYPEALAHAQQALVLDPEFWIGYMMRGQAYAQLGQTGPALEALAAGARLSGNNSKTLSLRGYVLAQAGRAAEARAVLTTLETVASTRYVPPYAFAIVHAGLGDRGASMKWLERAYDVRDAHLVFLTVDPKWDPFRGDPRFDALLLRLGFRR
jgi:TolB-like protein/Flp pilus assembly protein TadD